MALHKLLRIPTADLVTSFYFLTSDGFYFGHIFRNLGDGDNDFSGCQPLQIGDFLFKTLSMHPIAY